MSQKVDRSKDELPDWPVGTRLRCVDAKRSKKLTEGAIYEVVVTPVFDASAEAPAVFVSGPGLHYFDGRGGWVPCWRLRLDAEEVAGADRRWGRGQDQAASHPAVLSRRGYLGRGSTRTHQALPARWQLNPRPLYCRDTAMPLKTAVDHSNDPIPDWPEGTRLRCINAFQGQGLRLTSVYVVVKPPRPDACLRSPAVFVKGPGLERYGWEGAWLPCWRFQSADAQDAGVEACAGARAYSDKPASAPWGARAGSSGHDGSTDAQDADQAETIIPSKASRRGSEGPVEPLGKASPRRQEVRQKAELSGWLR